MTKSQFRPATSLEESMSNISILLDIEPPEDPKDDKQLLEWVEKAVALHDEATIIFMANIMSDPTEASTPLLKAIRKIHLNRYEQIMKSREEVGVYE